MFNIPLSSNEPIPTSPNLIEEQLIDNNISYKSNSYNYLEEAEKPDVMHQPMLRRHGLFNNYISVNKACTPPARPLQNNLSMKPPDRRYESSEHINTTLSSINPSLANALSTLQSKSPIISSRNMQFVSNPRCSTGRNYKERVSASNPRSNDLNQMSRYSHTEEKCGSSMTSRQYHINGTELSPTVSHVVFNGQATEVPDEILCHLCQFPMKICYRKSKYKSEIREYPAYRCLRKGCQTFRAIRKVIDPSQVTRVPVNRKRKPELAPADFLKEFLAPSEKLGSSAEITNREGPPKQTLGTLIYVPAVLTQPQIHRVQEAAMKVVLDSVGVVVTPMVAPSPYKYDQIRESLESDDGLKVIQKLFMDSEHSTLPTSSSDTGEMEKPCISPVPTGYSQQVIMNHNTSIDCNNDNCGNTQLFSLFNDSDTMSFATENPIDMELNFDNFDEFDTQ
ncbi:unnamed protein product [Auanema sp. JU1783]|nr:unnamed protein product [Auanema sp. JU1783]